MPHLGGACISLGPGGTEECRFAAEYEDPDEEEQHDDEVSRYVEIAPGSGFYFRINLHSNFDWGAAKIVVTRAYLDGKFVNGVIFHKSRTATSKHEFLDGIWSGTGYTATHHRWTFANLDTSDHFDKEDVKSWNDKYGDLGKGLATMRSTYFIGGDVQAAYYIINNIDNGSGYSIENVEDNAADIITGSDIGSDSEGNGAGGSPTKRQINKIVGGFGKLGDALGEDDPATAVVNLGDELDTYGTNGQGNIGYDVSEIEDPILPQIVNDVTDVDPDGTDPALNDMVPAVQNP